MIVHILHHGFALCRFSDKLPGDWPEGHRWVGADEAAYATCGGCIAANNRADYERLIGPQVTFLLKDAQEAQARGDDDTAAFNLLQIFKLCGDFHKSRPPSPEQVEGFEKSIAERGIDLAEAKAVMGGNFQTVRRAAAMIFRTGDRVTIHADERIVPGEVVLASGNGKSLVLRFEAILHGHVGMMPVMALDDGGYISLAGGHAITLKERD